MTEVVGVVLPGGHFADIGEVKVAVFTRLLILGGDGYDHGGDIFVEFFCCSGVRLG